MLFEEASERFLKYASRRHVKQGLYNITQDFNNKILNYFKGKDIFELTKIDFLDWQEYIISHDYSNSYNKLLYYYINSFLDFCCAYLNLPVNFMREIGEFPKKVEKDKHDFYTLKEFKQFIKHVSTPEYKCFFYIMFYVGTRPSECMALKFSDLNGKFLTIDKSLERHGQRNICTTKNSSSIRTIIIDRKLRKMILKLKKYYLNKYGAFNNDYFICGGVKPLSPTSIDRYKLKACKLANLRVITQHQFRSSHATLLTSHNVPVNEVARRLGHSNTETTIKRYIRFDKSQEKRVLRTLNFLRFI